MEITAKTRLTPNPRRATTCLFTAFLALFSPLLAAQFSVTPNSVQYFGGGGTYQSLAITAPANVTWTVTTSNPSWLTFNWGYSSVNGTGPGSVNLDVQANNSGASR